MGTLLDRLTVTSPTFRPEWLEEIQRAAAPFHPDGHYQYPADEGGNHLQGFFLLEPVVRNAAFVTRIRDDLVGWARRERISPDLLFAPAAPAVKVLANAIAKALGIPAAFWEEFPSGRFGERLVEGHVDGGAKALVFNGVSHTGRCVGLRLPEFLERLGGTTIAAAVFVKGIAPKVRETEERMGSKFYSVVRADVPVYAPAECPLDRSRGPPVPWTELLRSDRP
jgi:orotate phosphoribosyltransferase